MANEVRAQRADAFEIDDDEDPIAAVARMSNSVLPTADPMAMKSLAERRGFGSREPAPVSASVPLRRPPRVHRTGRNKQLTIKVTEEAYIQFYDLADKYSLVLGEAFQHALDAWMEKVSAQDH